MKMRNVFATFYSLLFCIPPLEKRPSKRFILNQYAVVGYDPHSVESYILYKSFMLALWIFVISTALYALPLVFQGTGLAGSYVFPDYWHYLPDRPVDYYKYGFPQTVSVPLIGITCIYAVILSYTTRAQHSWNFSGTRPVYLQNMARLKRKMFGFTRLSLLHIAFPCVLVIAIYYMWGVLDAWNLYIATRYIHDFSIQTFTNFITIVVVYLFFPACNDKYIFCFRSFVVF